MVKGKPVSQITQQNNTIVRAWVHPGVFHPRPLGLPTLPSSVFRQHMPETNHTECFWHSFFVSKINEQPDDDYNFSPRIKSIAKICKS